MAPRFTFIFFFLGLLFISLGKWACTSKGVTSQNLDGEALFVHEIQPILNRKCMSCHGHEEEDIRGEFDMRNRAALLKGGQSGKAAIDLDRPELSPLISAIKRLDPDLAMPPKEDEALATEEIELFEDWVALGAPWPDEEKRQLILAAGDWQYGNRITVQTSGGQTEEWDNRRYKLANLWAFLPLQKTEVPWKTPKGDQKHPIDAFIEQKLKESGLSPAMAADKRTLIRRATFDLTGLPPALKEIENFLADSSPDAFEKVINRLLDSPHYGEKWAQHWLDVVRYADSDGYSNDFIRPNAWRYRDYVINAFNTDKAYSQFVLEQIAGDEIDPNDPEMLVASGFLRMGPWEHTHMSIAAETRQLFLDDVSNIVGETFLSLPLSCAKCHDHKYDPIPTRDYYQIQAVFASTQFADRKAAYLPRENLRLSKEEKQRLEDWIINTREESEAMNEKEEKAAKEWFRSHGKRYLPKHLRRKLPEDQQPPRYFGLTFQDLGYRKVLKKRMQTLKKTKMRFEPLAYSVYNGPNRVVYSYGGMMMPEELAEDPPGTFILEGGSVYAPGEEVSAGVLSAVAALARPLDDAEPYQIPNPIPQSLNGRRLALAKWMTRSDHPLVVRSIVNRIWQYHFGKGLAENANNFGGTGKQPTHPALLEWVAQYFIENNWSIKALHRLIMSSEAYKRSSRTSNEEKRAIIDPDNKLLSVFSPRRLGAEEIRDAMLFISGELNPEMGGLPIRPEINQEIALQPRHTMGSIAQAYQPSPKPSDRNRRTIYAERFRNLPNPMLNVFNQPSTELSCERRTTSTVTPQVFSMLNSPQMRDRAIALALRLDKEAPQSLRTQVQLAAQLIWNRNPSTKELEQSIVYVQEMKAYHQKQKAIPVNYPTQVKRKMFEEMTGEPFEYIEELDVYQSYIPDVKDADVSPDTRALADLALVFFNTNEFIYVY